MPIEDCDPLAEDQEEKGKRRALPSPLIQVFGITEACFLFQKVRRNAFHAGINSRQESHSHPRIKHFDY